MRTRLTLLFIAIISNLTGQPNPRHLEEIAFDPVRNKLVVYGGVENHEGKWVESNSLFELGENGWQKFDEPGPGNRRAAAMAFDEVGKETLVIGGVRDVGGTDSVLFDVWSWNGKSWKLLVNNCPVKEPRAAFNSDTGRLFVYGVVNNKTVIDYSGEQIYELWEFGLGKWNKLSGDGPAERPAQMAYDRTRKVLVIPAFEDGEATVWEWKSEAWTKIGCQSQCPVGRTRFAFGYSVSDEASYLFGGLDFERKQLGDSWKWKGSQWERVELTNGPSVRNSAHFASGNDRLFLYGGSVPAPASPGQTVISNELWVWENGSWSTAQY